MKILTGKTAIVTGSASGIGRATAIAMAEAGAAVVIADINIDGAKEVALHIHDAGGKALAVATDIREPQQIERMVEQTVTEFGGIDVLCNNAADLSLLQGDGDFLQTDITVWDQTYIADQRSVMLACKYVLPHVLEAGKGSIINVSSVDGVSGDNTRFAYGAAKSAINLLTLSTATTYGKQGIRCNAVLPGLVLSPPAKQALAQNPEMLQAFEQNTLTPELGTPEQIASVILFLASDMAAYVNGQLINVDGGFLSHVPHYAQIHQFFSKLPGK